MKYSIILITLFFSCNSFNEIKKFNFEGELLYGNIKSVTTISYELVSASGDLTPGNKQGNSYSIEFINDTIIEEMTFDLSERATDKSRFIYNNQNSLLKKYISCLNGIGQLAYEGFYDNSNNKVKEKVYSYGNELMMTANFEYDSNNRIIKGEAISNTFLPSGYWKYQYDKTGNVLSEDFYINESNFLRNSDKNEYDNKNRISKKISFNNHRGETTTSFFKYNEKDNLIYKKTVYSSSTIITETFEYKFDEKGNWIEKHYFVNGVPSSFIVRSIVYGTK